MLRKAERDLHLLAAGDPAVNAPAVVEDAMDQRVVDVVDGPGEFAPDQIMRDIGGQPQIGKAVEQLQREEQVGGHAVAVRLHVHGDTGLVREPAPSLDIGDAVLQVVGPHVRLQVDMVGAEPRHQLQHRFEIVEQVG